MRGAGGKNSVGVSLDPVWAAEGTRLALESLICNIWRITVTD